MRRDVHSELAAPGVERGARALDVLGADLGHQAEVLQRDTDDRPCGRLGLARIERAEEGAVRECPQAHQDVGVAARNNTAVAPVGPELHRGRVPNRHGNLPTHWEISW